MFKEVLKPRYEIALILLLLTGVEALAQSPERPLLYSQQTSTRAIALDALLFKSEPFLPSSSLWLGIPGRPRVLLFAKTFPLLAPLTADAEDASHYHYQMTVEDIRPVPGQPWMSQIVVSFDENVADVGDVLISVRHYGLGSNRVRVGIGHVGGGPADDAGALPTPAPPYTIAGRVITGSTGFIGAQVTLSGPQSATVTSDGNGVFSFSVMAAGDYTLTVVKNFYVFTPASKTLNDLSGSRLGQDFSATRKLNTISGRIQGDQNDNLDAILVSLSSDAPDFQPRTISTVNGGLFSFSDLPAGYNYTLTPTETNIYLFSPQSVQVLDSDLALSFSGTRRHYNITGTVTTPSHQAASGVSVTLSGASNGSVITGANGSFSFPNLLAGFSYNVTVAKVNFIFDPPSRTYELLDNERADFTAIRSYTISGQVTDGSGAGLFGITMVLTGTEQHNVSTASDGTYSIIVTTPGDYLLAPTKEQDFYNFTPKTRYISDLIGNQVANFTGSFSSASNPSYVLEFDGTPMTVDYGDFWPENVNLGHFFWEFWAMPGQMSSVRYLLSDGYGGTHALLFGFNNSSERGRYSLFGNIWTGSTWVYFDSDDGPGVNEWGHYAVGWDGSHIITYYDGVPAGKHIFTGPRVCMGRGWGSGMPLLGGSDHQNFIGRVAQVRAYEGSNPLGSAAEVTFAPQTVFSREGQLLSYFFRSSQSVADLSSGYQSIPHAGKLRGFSSSYIVDCPTCPTPKYVTDPTAPNFSNPSDPGTITTPPISVPTTPAGAIIFDSFSRNNSTYILGGKGGLGATESGSAGPEIWQTGVDSSLTQPFGILSGRAVLLANQTSVAWVTTDSADLDIRVDRRLGGFGSGLNTGLSFRVVDKNNFFFAYTSDLQGVPGALNKLTVGYYQAGVRTDLVTDIPLSSDTWKELRVVTRQSGAIEIHSHDVLLYSTSNTLFATARGAGLYNNGPGLGLTNRWDNFRVFPAP